MRFFLHLFVIVVVALACVTFAHAQTTQQAFDQAANAQNIKAVETLKVWVYSVVGLMALVTTLFVPAALKLKTALKELFTRSTTNTSNIQALAGVGLSVAKTVNATPLSPSTPPGIEETARLIRNDPTTPAAAPDRTDPVQDSTQPRVQT